ncbi:polysaccharide pyruvyl transferase family protein [Brevibacterium sp. 'Marine']|uniref:polysaccharide pyruvyl transferase family protein n=1 Tax=Brevibacterium sp. 'Marine' TaxID=2725563 RepID=UPI00145D3D43|nr:polysaccharide pyruvyl transferase family protein [Brevibacterium sp. 'Marine']
MDSFEILVLTNRDSDNVGDQIIEASVISLLKTVAVNLGLKPEKVVIRSRAASLISRKYISTLDESLLEPARRAISRADVVIFGGAPLFNYRYQTFYLRTIRTVEIAAEYDVPVLFSSIGIEPYSAENPRSQQLKKALALSVVKQITTRDDLESAKRYVEGTDISTALVSDPAVFADTVLGIESRVGPSSETKARRRIGLVVTRAGIFKDNGIDFDEAAQRRFWLDVIADLEARGDDYHLFTTGHFTDEIFLDSLVRHHGVSGKKATVIVNSPEELVAELEQCDGVIAYRLHASITSFALGIPSIGLNWNFKVPDFYRSMGYPERALDHSDWNSKTVLLALDTAMSEGVTKDPETLMTVYRTLFAGLKGIVAPDSQAEPFTIGKLRERMPRYQGTSRKQYQEKVRRKLRRSYEFYQRRIGVDVAKSSTVAEKSKSLGSVAARALRKLRARHSRS